MPTCDSKLPERPAREGIRTTTTGDDRFPSRRGEIVGTAGDERRLGPLRPRSTRSKGLPQGSLGDSTPQDDPLAPLPGLLIGELDGGVSRTVPAGGGVGPLEARPWRRPQLMND